MGKVESIELIVFLSKKYLDYLYFYAIYAQSLNKFNLFKAKKLIDKKYPEGSSQKI